MCESSEGRVEDLSTQLVATQILKGVDVLSHTCIFAHMPMGLSHMCILIWTAHMCIGFLYAYGITLFI